MDWDQWQLLDPLISNRNHLAINQLWAQHNEHRILIGRLLSYIDLFLFGGRNISLYIEIFVVQLCHLLLMTYVARTFGHFSRPVLVSLFGLLVYCFFSPLQLENFNWGFQISFVMAGFGASLSFAAALWYRNAENASGAKRGLALFTCIFGAAIAEASGANGVLCWPLLSFLAFVLGFRRRDQWIVAITGLTAILAYMIGYHSPTYHSDPLQTIRQPLQILKYCVTYFAASWDPHVPNSSYWPAISESLALLAMATVVVCAVRCGLERSRCKPLDAFLLAVANFMLGTAILTALGRLKLGYAQAAVSRYESYALVFWGCLAILIAERLQLSNRSLVAAQLFLMMPLFAGASRWDAIERAAMQRQERLGRGWDAVTRGSFHDPAVRGLCPTPETLPAYYAYLRQHHVGPRHSFAIHAKIEPDHGPTRIKEFRNVSACLGFVDRITPVEDRMFTSTVGLTILAEMPLRRGLLWYQRRAILWASQRRLELPGQT